MATMTFGFALSQYRRYPGLIVWIADHLFLDREGIPTLIEVKRSSDTRIRREVVGQMLDYAANSVAYRFHIRTAIPHHGLSATIPRIVRIPLPTRLT